MNTYNHHRIINQVASRINKEYPGIISNEDIQRLKDASDFTDDFAGETKMSTSVLSQKEFFFYHFYYDISCKNGIISLKRSNEGDYNYESGYLKCLDEEKKTSMDFYTDYYKKIKKFYIAINDFEADSDRGRIEYYNDDKLDSSNQSDCVAFLHAMGANGEEEETSKNIYLEHIKKCLSEFLFIKDRKKALYMLGIALHSLMDSFTPSHTGFKKYTEQDMAKHAQGDVLPFMGDSVFFDPGQYTDDGKASGGKTKIAAWIKGYNSNDTLNETEYEMLKIFIKSYLDSTDCDLGKYLRGEYQLIQVISKVQDWHLEFIGETNSKSTINSTLLRKKYKSNAYHYSEKAINIIKELFIEMTKKRQNCLNNYEAYKTEKESILNQKSPSYILKKWETEYESIQDIENYPATDERLYSKNQ